MDKKKKLRIIASVLCVILIAGVVLNQSGLLKSTEAESVWDGSFPTSVTAANYTYGKSAAGKTGSGTSASPYYISSAADLAQMQVNINGGLYNGKTVYFQLAQNINLNGNTWQPISDNRCTAVVHFDGAGNNITGLKMASSGSATYVGLFGYLDGGSVKNLNVVGAQLDFSTTGGAYAGGIVGEATNGCQIANCSFTGTITGYAAVGGICGVCDGGSTINGCSVSTGSRITAAYQLVGGIVGRLQGSSMVINCSNAGSVQLNASSQSSAAIHSAAGIAGYMDSSQIVNSYNGGSVGSNYLASGITMAKGGEIRNCYNYGTVSSDQSRAGAISASITNTTQLRNVFSLQNVAGTLIAEGSTGNSNMQDVGTFSTDQYLSKADFLDDSKWSYDKATVLKTALDSYVTIGINTYDNICEWAADEAGVNMTYPILTTKVGHVHDKAGGQTIKKEATCTESGIVVNKCSICGLIYEEPINPLGHHIVTETQPPTCTEDGWVVSKCDNTWHNEDGNEVACDYVEGDPNIISAAGHDYYKNDEALEHYEKLPTCEEDGYYVEVCFKCNYVNEDTRITAEDDPKYKALGHVWNDEEVKGADCTQPERHYQVCEVCGEKQTVTEGDPLNHEWNDENGIWRDATCVNKGGFVRTCNRCNIEEFVGESIKETPHNYVTYAAVEPTCTEQGYTEMYCDVCKEDFTHYQTNFVASLGHDYVLQSVVESTCTEKGHDHIVCTRCGNEDDVNEKELIPHKYVVTGGTDTSCMVGGNIEETCTECGNVKNTIVPAIGHHNYQVDPELSTEATCTEDGKVIERCVVCQNTNEVETIPALDHIYAYEVIEPTCLLGGYTTETCERGCGYSKVIDEKGPSGHNMVETIHKATTTEMGYTESACSRCDYTETYNYVAATPDATYDAVSATLTFNPEPAADEVEPVMLFLELISGQSNDTGEVMAYSLDNVEWVTTDALSVKITEDDLLFTADSALNTANIYVQRPGNMASESRPITQSAVQILEIERAQILDTAMISASAPSTPDGKGVITGVDDTMEWRAAADQTWTSVVGNTIENLEPGIYYVRAKANGSSPAGLEIMVDIPGYNSGSNTSTAPPSNDDGDDNNGGGSGSDNNGSGSDNNGSGSGNNGSGSDNNGSGSGNNGTSSDNNGSGSGNNGTSSGNNGSGSGSGSNGTGSGSGSNGTTVDADGNVVPNNVYYSSGSGSSTSGSSKSSNSTTKVTSAKTGDEMNLTVWLVVAGVAATALAVVSAKKRRDAEE